MLVSTSLFHRPCRRSALRRLGPSPQHLRLSSLLSPPSLLPLRQLQPLPQAQQLHRRRIGPWRRAKSRALVHPASALLVQAASTGRRRKCSRHDRTQQGSSDLRSLDLFIPASSHSNDHYSYVVNKTKQQRQTPSYARSLASRMDTVSLFSAVAMRKLLIVRPDNSFCQCGGFSEGAFPTPRTSQVRSTSAAAKISCNHLHGSSADLIVHRIIPEQR